MKHNKAAILILCAVLCALCACGKTHVHLFSEWTVEKEPSCAETGLRTRTCACGATESEEIEKPPHTEVPLYTVEPTCTDQGLVGGTVCAVCGQTVKPHTVVPAKGHVFGEWKTLPSGARTRTCALCGFTETEEPKK